MAEAIRSGWEVLGIETPMFGVVFAHGESVVGMTEFQGRLIVATTVGIYEVEGKRLVKLRLERFDPDA